MDGELDDIQSPQKINEPFEPPKLARMPPLCRHQPFGIAIFNDNYPATMYSDSHRAFDGSSLDQLSQTSVRNRFDSHLAPHTLKLLSLTFRIGTITL
jgi:hypothetical protein